MDYFSFDWLDTKFCLVERISQMPRHQTSRELDTTEDNQTDKLAVFRKYAQLSAEIQEYGSAALGALEGIFWIRMSFLKNIFVDHLAILIIVATSFLYSGIVETKGNYASFAFITGQVCFYS